MKTSAAAALLLPLLAGDKSAGLPICTAAAARRARAMDGPSAGWERVKLFALVHKFKSEPLPNPPLRAGEGAQACRGWRMA